MLLSQVARLDLEEIWLYIAQDDTDAADQMIDRIIATFDRLASMPDSGRARPELAADVRSFPCGRYVVFYRPIDDGVGIARVLHGGRDLQQQDFPTPPDK